MEALEVGVEISCTGSGAHDLAAAVAEAWESCLVAPGDAPAHRLDLLLEDDPDELARRAGDSHLFGGDLPTLMDRLSPMVTRLAVTERRHDLVLLHACAVGDPDTGDAVVLYGPSGAGKTTLARTLGTDLAYLTDETAGIDGMEGGDDLRVVPYPKPLSVIAAPGDAVKAQLSPCRLGLVPPGDTSFRLRALVQLARDPGHRGDAVLERRATVDALPELVAQTSFTREMQRPLHRLAGLADRVGGVRRATYSEAAQLRPLVGALLGGAT